MTPFDKGDWKRMMNKSERTIISRRSRPAKDPLSKDLIVRTGLEILKNQGLSGLSMRKIAKDLDTGPSSLYVYVKNVQELRAYVLDYGLEKVVLSDNQDGHWKDELFDVLESYLMTLYESPGIAELALTTLPIGPNSLAMIEYILQRLHAGGIHSTSAAWGVDQLFIYATSVAFEQASRKQNGTAMDSLYVSYHSVDAKEYPIISSLKEELFSGEQERFRWGLEVILQGMLQMQK